MERIGTSLGDLLKARLKPESSAEETAAKTRGSVGGITIHVGNRVITARDEIAALGIEDTAAEKGHPEEGEASGAAMGSRDVRAIRRPPLSSGGRVRRELGRDGRRTFNADQTLGK